VLDAQVDPLRKAKPTRQFWRPWRIAGCGPQTVTHKRFKRLVERVAQLFRRPGMSAWGFSPQSRVCDVDPSVCHTSKEVKSRLTAWFAALLMVSAVFGTPVVRVAVDRLSYCQVYCEEKAPRGEQVIVVGKRPRPVRAVVEIVPARESFRSAILADSLFQRPPPLPSL
jgi:hypothetical protein